VGVIGAVVVVGYLVLGGNGDTYKVTAEFQNASQLVPGNEVEVAGVAVGTVKKIRLGQAGEAEVEMQIEEDYAPLRRGTVATVRSQSLSGIANRYIALDLPSEEKAGDAIADGGMMSESETVSEVDLDEIFNTFTPETVEDLKNVVKGFSRAYDGVGAAANEGFAYLNPFLSTSRRLFGELNSDEAALERLVVDSAVLTGAVAERGPDLAGFITNVDQMMNAIGRQGTSLARAVANLPDFMRTFNTTGVNLRAALDDIDPLVDASKPVAKKLRPFFRDLRGATTDLVPAIKDLDQILRRPGADNDLIELTKLNIPLAKIAVGPVRRNGALRDGALPATAEALNRSLPQLAFFRPYITQEGISGWFDDFGHSGTYDANGGMGRISTTFNLFTFSLPGLPDLTSPLQGNQILNAFGPSGINNLKRCPGANERNPGDGSTPFTDNGTLDCNPNQVPTGP
jgi:phospholipid/cholesterol/gamma-HCH transport system substrate-binding protein